MMVLFNLKNVSKDTLLNESLLKWIVHFISRCLQFKTFSFPFFCFTILFVLNADTLRADQSKIAESIKKAESKTAEGEGLIYQDAIEEIRSRRDKVERRIEIAGLTPSVLAYLKKSKNNQINILKNLRTSSEEKQTAIELKLLEIEEDLEDLDLLDSEYLILDQARQELDQELDQLIEVGVLREQLRQESIAFIAYIDQRILWTRSHPALWKLSPIGLIHELEDSFYQFRKHATIKNISVTLLSFLLALLPTFILKRWIKQTLNQPESGKKFLSLCFMTCAQTFPVLILLDASSPLYDAQYPPTWSMTLKILSFPLALWLVRKVFFSRGGLFLSLYPHANEPAQQILGFDRNLLCLGCILALSECFESTRSSSPDYLSGFLTSVVWLCLGGISLKLFNVLRSSKKYFFYRRDFESGTLHLILLAFFCVSPLPVALLHLTGYRNSAEMIATSLAQSMSIVLAWNLGQGLLWWLRSWLGKEANDDAKELRAEGENIDAQYLRSADEGLVRIFRLIGWMILIGGFAWVWSDVLQAFEFTKNIVLWKGSDESNVTIFDLCLVAFAIYVGVLTQRNLRDALDIYIFVPMGVSQGNRYAISTVSRYVMFLGMSAFVFYQLGFNWASIQWLAAAFSVGLGFGVQEIFANFISGLILLFERPVRVGDVISLDKHWGVVQRINIRSTTILNWDRQEIIIPNKELITGQLTNWTLSDHHVRIIIKVGVAYKTDIEQAKSILHTLAIEHPRIASNPKPMVTFMEFGDSSLNLEMDVFLIDFQTEDDLDEVRDEINVGILKRFRETGITIPYPQRDVYQYQIPYDPAEHQPES